MTSDIALRQQAFRDATGMDIRLAVCAQGSQVWQLAVYNRMLAGALSERINRHISNPHNLCVMAEAPVNAGDGLVSYHLNRWHLELPMAALTEGLCARLGQDALIRGELSVHANTLRDHYFAMINAIANFSGCNRETEALVQEEIARVQQAPLERVRLAAA